MTRDELLALLRDDTEIREAIVYLIDHELRRGRLRMRLIDYARDKQPKQPPPESFPRVR